MSGKQCSKYLVTMIKDWIGPYQIIYGKLEISTINKLLAISPATIDRLLRQSKYKALRRGISGTKAGILLKEEIVLSDNHWDDKKSGYFEADTVALCGDSVKGQFIWCLNMTDVATGWTEVRACWGKSADAILNRMKEIETAIPMPLLGCDCDNGSEFLNYKILEHLQKRRKPVQFARSRPYRKNDNAHVEQKNYTHVRKLLGYLRYDKPELTPLVNDLLANDWCKFKNFFIPCQKTVKKIRVGSKIKRIMDGPKTPYRRLMDSDFIDQKTKRILAEEFKSLNPILLSQSIDKQMGTILNIIKMRDKPKELH